MVPNVRPRSSISRAVFPFSRGILAARAAEIAECYTCGARGIPGHKISRSPQCVQRIPRLVGEWLSLVEHLVRDQGVGGSNPLSPTNLFNKLQVTQPTHLVLAQVI